MKKNMKTTLTAVLSVTLLSLTGCNSTGDYANGENPLIKLEGPTDINITLGTTQILTSGDVYSAYDAQDGDLTYAVHRTHDIDFTKAGNYKITYKVTDSDGNTDIKYRTVTISSSGDYEPYTGEDRPNVGFAPSINFTDGKSDTLFVNIGSNFDAYLNVSAHDFEDGDLTNQMTVSHNVDTTQQGVYSVTYSVTDSNGNETTRERTVNVANYTDGTSYADTSDIGMFKTWYSETCGNQFNESLYNVSTGEYYGDISCSNQNLSNIDLTSLSIFTTIKSLDLSHNNLSYIDFNQLDLSVNNVKVLEDLDLSHNNFTEIDFTPLHNLRNINNLWIQGNNLDYNTKAKREALYRIFNNRSLTIFF